MEERTVGNYRLLTQLGKGALGGVYRAIREDGKVYAVKIPEIIEDPNLTEEQKKNLLAEACRRLRDEACALRNIGAHPNLVQMWEYRDGEEGTPYLVLSLIGGCTLGDVVDTMSLTKKEIVGITHQIVRGLAAMHSKGLIHRDIKPCNVMITNSPVGYKVTIIDLGTARPAIGYKGTTNQHAAADSPTVTVVGTPGYMSPEQALGGQQIGTSSDLFSVGCILYEMLREGERLFDGKTVQEVLDATARGVQLDPALVESLGEGLYSLLTGLLEYEPQNRPNAEEASRMCALIYEQIQVEEMEAAQEAARAADELRYLKNASKPAALPPPVPEPERRTSTPPREKAIWPALVAAFALLGIVGLLLYTRAEDSPRRGGTSVALARRVLPRTPAFRLDIPAEEPTRSVEAPSCHLERHGRRIVLPYTENLRIEDEREGSRLPDRACWETAEGRSIQHRVCAHRGLRRRHSAEALYRDFCGTTQPPPTTTHPSHRRRH